jgi:zinc protease
VSRLASVSSVLFLCGLGTAAAAQSTRPIPWPTEQPPRPLPARDIAFPHYELQTLPNGLQVVAVLHHEQPVVSMRMLVRAGTAHDPKGKLGLAHLLASLLDQGVAGSNPRTAAEMNDAIDFIGGEMGAGAGTDWTMLNVTVMKDSFETGLRMLSDMSRYPAFEANEIERQRQQMVSGLQVSLQDPEYVANSVFDRLVYGFHPYGMPDSGTPETLGALTRDDLVAFHRRYFAPNNAILAVVGDLTADEAFAAAKKVFGDWEKRDLPADHFVDPPDPTRRVVVVDKPDAVQTEVRVGHIGIARNHPDYMALNMAIRILGGEGSNRLHQVLRTQRGLTYGAQASFDTLKETGDFEAQTNTRSDATGEVLRLIVDEFWRLQRERVSEVELIDAKAYLAGSFPLTIETPGSIAMQVVTVLFYGLPVDQLQNFRERVNAVSVDDVQRVAQKYLRPDRLSIVLVGNASAFSSQLARIGFGTFETVSLPDLDLTAVDFKRSRARADRAGPARGAGWAGLFHPATPADPVRPAYRQSPAPIQRPAPPVAAEDSLKALELLDRAIAAKGGLDRLRGIKTIVAKQTLTTQTQEGSATVESTNYLGYPDRFRIETITPKGLVTQGFDGRFAWLKDPAGLHAVSDGFVRDVKANLRREVVSLLVAARDGALTTRLLPDVRDALGKTNHAIELSARDLNPIVLQIDPASWLIAKETFIADIPSRPVIEEEFSDYRPIDGVQIPFQATRRTAGQTVDRRVVSITINQPIDPALFARPAS